MSKKSFQVLVFILFVSVRLQSAEPVRVILTAILHRPGIKKLLVIQDHKELDCILLADKALFNFDPQGKRLK
ncbi:MAG: hypothetical protein LUD15_04310 [Bacteroides sp.]|nr:hypothetical protein [Bacteroides sp.]